MRIHCDHCGIEIEKEKAFVREIEEEPTYFCSEACFARASRIDPYQAPERDEEGGSGPQTAPDPGEPEEVERGV